MDMSHLEKLDFLEKIAAVDYDVKNLKINIKNNLLSLAREMVVLDAQISQTEKMLQVVHKPVRVDKPVPSADIVDLVLTVSNDNVDFNIVTINDRIKQELVKMTKYDCLTSQIECLTKEVESLRKLPNIFGPTSVSDLTAATIKMDTRLVVLKNRLDTIKMDEMYSVSSVASVELVKKYQNVTSESVAAIKSALFKVEETIMKWSNIVDRQRLVKLQTKLEEVVHHEKSEWQFKVDTVQQKILKVEQLIEPGDNIKNLEKLMYRLSEAEASTINYDSESVRTEMESLKAQFFRRYECFDCGSAITIDMNTFLQVAIDAPPPLSKITGEGLVVLRERLNGLASKLEKIETNETLLSNNPTSAEIQGKIDHLKQLKKLKKNMVEINHFQASAFSDSLNHKLTTLRERVGAFPVDDSEFVTVEDLDSLKDKKRDVMIQLNQELANLSIREDLDFKVKRGEKYDPQDHAKVLEEIDCLTEESASLSQAIETANIEEKLDRDIGNLNECRNLLNFNAENVPQLEQELILLNKVKVYHKQYNVYSRFQSDLKKYKNVKSSLKELHIMKNKVEVNHATTVLFKHKVVESENDSLNFVVSLINTHLSMFLTDFFSEESDYPIYVRLELVLDNNKRPQVNTVINYKGSIVDQKSLSTGEYARVKLAFDLTFKEILGESIVMLDECTANLDEDLSTKIFYDIKKSFPHRTILAVSHQATSGCFENFVTL
jgi:hypothetical protein